MIRRSGMPRALRALTFPVLLAVAISAAGILASRAVLPKGWFEGVNEVVGGYLQTVGTVYAVLLAWVVFVVWSQFNETRGHTEKEATEIRDLYFVSRGLPESARAELLNLLKAYVQTVLRSEWKAMGIGDPSGLREGSRGINQMWTTLVSCEPCTGCEQAFFSEALARLNDLSDARTSRISASRARIPGALKILLYTGAFTVVSSMALFSVVHPVPHVIMTAALAGTIAHVLYLIHDLDAAFEGDWQVPRDPFERVEQLLEGGGGD